MIVGVGLDLDQWYTFKQNLNQYENPWVYELYIDEMGYFILGTLSQDELNDSYFWKKILGNKTISFTVMLKGFELSECKLNA